MQRTDQPDPCTRSTETEKVIRQLQELHMRRCHPQLRPGSKKDRTLCFLPRNQAAWLVVYSELSARQRGHFRLTFFPEERASVSKKRMATIARYERAREGEGEL
jgi:hypothetical protein